MLEIDAKYVADRMIDIINLIAERLHVIALLKGHMITIDDSALTAPLKVDELRKTVEEFLVGSSLREDFYVKVEKGKIKILPHDPGRIAPRKSMANMPPNMYICPHCSKISSWEEEHFVHVKSHYAGF